MEWISRKDWEQRSAAHRDRLLPYVEPHLERRRQGIRHPVFDFLFTYYSLSPSALQRWHPGYGSVMLDAEDRLDLKGYARIGEGVGVSEAHLTSQVPLLEQTRELLRATAGRAPQFGCFGLHEWAMVYRLDQEQVRHTAWPLRLGADGTDSVVESHRIGCSHFDAFRFFTEPARPLNTLQPGRDDRSAFEQPACLHAGMDLYKHSFRLLPMVPSDLVADCFELARDIRTLDMRASPYDLRDLGYEPVLIETPEGKQEYVEAQRAFLERGAPLRAQVLDLCEQLHSQAARTRG